MTTTAKELLCNDQYKLQIYDQGGVLYRGIKGVVSEILEEYNGYLSNKIQPLFYPSFLSTSSKINVAKNFSFGIIFEIHLSQENPHPHIRLINHEWSQYPDERNFNIFLFSISSG